MYQLSKNECMSLRRLCDELREEKEEHRKKCPLTDDELHNTHVSPRAIELSISEATDPFGILREEKKLSLEAVGDKTANLHDRSVTAVVLNEASLLLGDEYCGQPEVDLKSGEFKQSVTVSNRTADDENQSSFSFIEMQSTLASSGDDVFGNNKHEKTHDFDISSDVSGNDQVNFDICLTTLSIQ